MPTPRVSREQAEQAVAWVQEALAAGFRLNGQPSAFEEIHRRHGVPSGTVRHRYKKAWSLYEIRATETDVVGGAEPVAPRPISEEVRVLLISAPRTLAELCAKTGAKTGQVLDAVDELTESGANVHRVGDRYEIPKFTAPGYLNQEAMELVSGKDNRFLFGVVGDNHCGSKYERREVFADLYDRFAAAGVRHVFHAGNWIEGSARFNRHDLLVDGLEQQCQMLAETYPQRDGITTYAVWGDDHEGWFAQREGIDVGAYCESVMRKNGREDWINLGFMEAHIRLVNVNTGVTRHMNVQHPGGGSAYAISYRPQKILESMEGGEKPAIIVFGHYHKLDAGLIRNVWYVQAGTGQDQTPFMRKKAIEAHVGGALIECEQDPESGAIVEFVPRLRRYFNRDFYTSGNPTNKRWSHSGPVTMPRRTVMGA